LEETAEFSGFPKETVRFLRELTTYNDKAWFDAHRSDYEAAYVAPALAFVAAIGPKLRKISPAVAFEAKVNGSLFRINRDVRFAKDKTPYRNHIDLWFWHGGHRGREMPGFFFRLFADRLILGAGMHKFEKAQLDAYRAAVVDARSGKALDTAVGAVRGAGPYAIGGAARKTVPKGFDADHERAGLLLHEGLWAERDAKAGRELHDAGFVDLCLGHFRAMWPVGRWLLDHVAPSG
jgi:uncharacterized protein (TIGR02453 family)